ncbi:MAG: 3-isopropylmalate dehydratase, partial [Nitrospinota bacterium]
MLIRGRVWKFGDDINTDLIMPQVAFALPLEEQIRYVFRANRPGWVEQVREGDIIVAGRNFGT